VSLLHRLYLDWTSRHRHKLDKNFSSLEDLTGRHLETIIVDSPFTCLQMRPKTINVDRLWSLYAFFPGPLPKWKVLQGTGEIKPRKYLLSNSVLSTQAFLIPLRPLTLDSEKYR
jgi:hypothetical protein